MIRIKFNDNEHTFSHAADASTFLLRRLRDCSEFVISWPSENRTAHWYYTDPVFIDQKYGEFKCSPHGDKGDFDTDCFWIPALEEDVLDELKWR